MAKRTTTKTISQWEAEVAYLMNWEKKRCEQITALLTHNAMLRRAVEKAIDVLSKLGVSDETIRSSGLLDLLQPPRYGDLRPKDEHTLRS